MAPFGRPPMLGGVKQKTNFKAIMKLASYTKRFLPVIIVALLLSALGAVTSIIGPNKISDLMNILSDGIVSIDGVDLNVFVDAVVVLVIIYAIGAIASYVQQFLMIILKWFI